MTIVSESYDYLVTNIQSILGTTWFRLNNPLDTANNWDLFLKKGWCISAGPMSNTKRSICPSTAFSRDFTITLTKEILEQEAAFDIDAKDILEGIALLNQFVDDNGNVALTSGTVTMGIISDTGLVPIGNESGKFIFTEITIKLEMFMS